jgi:hypothetical protein
MDHLYVVVTVVTIATVATGLSLLLTSRRRGTEPDHVAAEELSAWR